MVGDIGPKGFVGYPGVSGLKGEEGDVGPEGLPGTWYSQFLRIYAFYELKLWNNCIIYYIY